MKEKSEVGMIFANFHKMVQTQFQTSIQILRTDNGREYYHSILGSYLQKHGIIHQSSCVNTPQQNGIAERKNRHLLEVTRSLMLAANVPSQYWGDAVLSATYLINRMPSKVLKFNTPYHTLQSSYPNTHLFTSIPLKIFGSTAFVHNHQPNRSKLDPKSVKCIFLGYSPHQKGYKCYSPSTRKFYYSMDVTFFENQPYYPKVAIQGERTQIEQESQLWPIAEIEMDTVETLETASPIIEHTSETHETEPSNPSTQADKPLLVYSRRRQKPQTEPEACTFPKQSESSSQIPELPEIHQGNTIPNPEFNIPNTEFSDLDMPIAIRKGVRSCTQHPIGNFISYEKLSQGYRAFITSVDNIQIPRDIQEALKHPDWAAAVEEEIHALEKNGTWDLSTLPVGKKSIGCKWIFSIKYNTDGSVNRYKARLVAKGFTQSYGVDYEETFAPVAKLNSVRVILSLAVNLDWPLHQLDIKNAFLNGELEEEVYMGIPPGLESARTSGKVCRLRKSLYGLKQSPRAWFDRLTRVVKGDGFIQCQTDHTMFIKHSQEGKLALFIVYVDDIIITGDDHEEAIKLKRLLAREFEVKDLGLLKYFLGMEIARCKDGISMSQRKYTLDLLKETGMLGCKPADTPMEPAKKGGIDVESPPTNRDRYQRLVGKLIYLTHTRPDIGFAVSMASRFMTKPTEIHMKAVYRILQYLKGTPGRGLHFKKNLNRGIEVFTDADWAGSTTDRKSTTGYCSFVWGNLVTWRSKKQSVVARSSAEAEFRAMSYGICEGIWLQRMFKELKIPSNYTMKVWCDNKAAISIAKNPVHHDRTKHVEIDRHFIKEKIDNNIINLEYTPSQLQRADILTKALLKPTYENLRSNLGMIDIYHPA